MGCEALSFLCDGLEPRVKPELEKLGSPTKLSKMATNKRAAAVAAGSGAGAAVAEAASGNARQRKTHAEGFRMTSKICVFDIHPTDFDETGSKRSGMT